MHLRGQTARAPILGGKIFSALSSISIFMSGQLDVLQACREGHSLQLLQYMLADHANRTQRMRRVLCTAAVAAAADEACWLLRNCATYIEPPLLCVLLYKMAAANHCTGLVCLLSLQLELYPFPVSDDDLVHAAKVAACSGRQGAMGLLLQACSERSSTVAELAHRETIMAAAAGGHRGALQAAMGSAREHSCMASSPAVQQRWVDLLDTAPVSVLMCVAGWGLEHLGADVMANHRARLAARALLVNRPGLCARLVRYPEQLSTNQQKMQVLAHPCT